MSTVDITPSPRVLRMLGQIDFAPWQCLAELIDNSIDAFIDQARGGTPPISPRIRIQLPSESEAKSGNGSLAISDNGRGMTLDQLSNAVRAGYSGNDPVEKMGLFGMGFNISTARLGKRTEVWTTTADSPDWIGLIIDFAELEKAKTFNAPINTKPKTNQELEESAHGTRVVISGLDADRIRPLNKGAGKRKTKERLGKIYGRIMSEMGITIMYESDRITPRKHCVWDETRAVETSAFGRVPAVINIDQELPAKRFCSTCWVWLADVDKECAACGHSKNVIERKRRLKGWIGVQRYFDKEHFGFDLIRNGRVIQELDKSMFSFENEDGEKLFEYPVDATHWGGRFVGELEIDFVRVSHQKDSFDKLDPEWKHVVEIVRGTSPIQPMIAKRMGLGTNSSPLARLFTGYRKGTAGLKDLVPGTDKGAGLNTGLIEDYLVQFEAGNPEYQSDAKWYELVLQAERAKRGESSGTDKAAGEFPIDDDEPSTGTGGQAGAAPGGPTPPPAAPEPVVPAETKDTGLSRTYNLPLLPGAPSIRVDAYQHTRDINGHPFRVKPEGSTFRFDYNIRSSYFEESLETPADCLLADLAQHFLAVSAQSPRDYPNAYLARELRKSYFPDSSNDISQASESATSMLDELKRHYDENLPSIAPIDISKVDQKLVDRTRQGALQAEQASSSEADKRIKDGRFARFVTRGQVLDLVRGWPALATDGKFFVIPYEDMTEENLRVLSLADLLSAIRDVVWLSEDGSSTLNKDQVWRLRLARALASLRLLQNWRA